MSRTHGRTKEGHFDSLDNKTKFAMDRESYQFPKARALATALTLGVLSVLFSGIFLSTLGSEPPVYLFARDLPLFLSIFLFRPTIAVVSILTAATIHGMIVSVDPAELVLIFSAPLVGIAIRILLPSAYLHIGYALFYFTAAQIPARPLLLGPPSLDSVTLALEQLAILTASLVQFSGWAQQQFCLPFIKGWLAHVVPLICTLLLFIVAVAIYPHHSGNALCLVLLTYAALLSLGFRPKNSTLTTVDDHDSTRNLLDSLLARPKGFSGFGKEFWQRKDDATHDTVALTSKLTTPISPPGNDSLKSDEAVCAVSQGGAISFVNRRFREFFGVTVNQVIGSDISAIGLDESIAQLFLTLVKRTDVRGPQIVEIRRALPRGSRFFEVRSMKAEELEGSTLSGDINSVLLIAREVTDRRSIESKLLQVQKLEWLGTIVSANINLLNDSLVQLRHHAKDLPESLGMLKTIENIELLISPFQTISEKQSSHREFVNLHEFFKEHIPMLERSAGISINYECTDPTLSTHVDRGALLHALTNLLLNSIQASDLERPNAVTLSIAREDFSDEVLGIQLGARPGAFIRLKLQDRGVGMTPETLSRAFEPFFSTKKSLGHQGLGLSVVFAFVREHDGFLSAESKLQEGTTMSLYLPMASQVNNSD